MKQLKKKHELQLHRSAVDKGWAMHRGLEVAPETQGAVVTSFANTALHGLSPHSKQRLNASMDMHSKLKAD